MRIRSDWASLIEILSLRAGQKILDVGAGKGDLAAVISKNSPGVEVYAVDPNANKVESIKRNHPEVKAAVSGSESIPFADGFFDGVYTTMALHHYADLDRALEEISRVLKLGGAFVVLEVEPGSAKGAMFRTFTRIMGEHLNLMTENQLSARLGGIKNMRLARSVKVGSGYIIQLVRV